MSTAGTTAAQYVTLRAVLHVKWHAVTNTKPARYSVHVRGYKPRFYTADGAESPGYPNTAQWAAERFIADEALPWGIAAGGMMPVGGDYVFIVEPKP